MADLKNTEKAQAGGNQADTPVERLREGRYWHGIYKGVGFKIQRWEREHNGDGLLNSTVWNYYIYLDLSKINKDDAKQLWLTGKKSPNSSKRKWYKYYDCEPLKDIELQGGITWYKKQYSLNDDKIVEIGCDYDHIWNDREYDLNEVHYDVKQSIESVLARFPELQEEAQK